MSLSPRLSLKPPLSDEKDTLSHDKEETMEDDEKAESGLLTED